MITPEAIARRAENLYLKFLKQWVVGAADGYFPRPIQADLKLAKNDVAGNQRAIERLQKKSKAARGWGYTLHLKQVNSPVHGRNDVPDRITIDTLGDLLKLAKREEEFQAISDVVVRTRAEFPPLSNWLEKNVRVLARYAPHLDGLYAVTRFFQANPLPGCYPQQIPAPVDTKFVAQHGAVLKAWLNLLLPPSAYNAGETDRFARRFGLREKQLHRGVRLLDASLLEEFGLPFEEFSLPARALGQLPVRHATVIVVENRVPLITVPDLPRSLVVCGEGGAVTGLEEVGWLDDNRIVYWGDIDVAGFEILSRFRRLFPHVESILMDRETMEVHRHRVGHANEYQTTQPKNLHDCELDAYRECVKNNWRLEQEYLRQDYVQHKFDTLGCEDGC